ncbi:hypothetical protein, conserved [Leishmania tarentolae]|uniref:Uncharacterized protein n=1 Tax=Leishmania tarentolae TaxID=5689 RepID=A0A640KPF1_LEITA|nr:hypothetical protein, conserved [Leishmania tarentolae]
MKDSSHATPALTSSSLDTSAVSGGEPIPWLPLSPSLPSGDSSAMIASGPSERWANALQKVPYLRSILEGPTCTVYRPPTVIQLSEATGCSVSKLAGAYSDLPVITLNKIKAAGDQEAASAAATAVSPNSDGFEYLQLSPTDDSLEMAAKALMARRPVPDAEEIFWEAEYWEVLRRAKRQAKEEKERIRERKMRHREKRAVMGASSSSIGMPSPKLGGAATLSSMNSPSFATPHSRQGSLGGPSADCGDTSPSYLHAQTAAQRTAKGLLRRARYNETHNPMQRVLVRTASLLSQNSATQSVIRCRTVPRHDSITFQQTLSGARGFQYPVSSLASEDGRSATSDSFRTPPTHIVCSHPSRELLATSLELDLFTSVGPANTDTITHLDPASAECVKGDTTATREIPQPHNEGGLPIASRDTARKRSFTAAATMSPDLSSLQISTNRCSKNRRRGKANKYSVGTSAKSLIVHRNAATHAPLIIPTSLPTPEPSAQRRISSPLLLGDGGKEQKCSPLPSSSMGSIRKPVDKQPPVAEGRLGEGGGGSPPQPLPQQTQLRSLPAMPRRSVGRSSADTFSVTVDGQSMSRCTTTRPLTGTNNARASDSASSRPSGMTPGTLCQSTSGSAVAGESRKAKSSPVAPSPAARETTATVPPGSSSTLSTATDVKVHKDGDKRPVTRSDMKLLPLHPNAAQPLPSRRLDHASSADKAFCCPSTPLRTTTRTAAGSTAPPHSSSTAQTAIVPQSASIPVTRAPVPKPSPSAGRATTPGIAIRSTVTGDGTAATAPSSCAPSREASLSLCVERVTGVTAAAPSTVSSDRAAAESSAVPCVAVAPPKVTKPPSAFTTPLASHQSTTAAVNAKDTTAKVATPPAQVSSTVSKADVAPLPRSDHPADENAAARPSLLHTSSSAADAGNGARNSCEVGAETPLPSRVEFKVASRCCAIM